MPVAAFLFSFFLGSTFAFAQQMNSGYALDTKNLCDGYPKLNVKTLDTLCMGLLAGKNQGLLMPRYAAQAKEGTIFITDMGGWAYSKGTVYALEISKNQVKLTDLFPRKLTMPNGIAVDPEGRVYVGTPTEIFRFNPRKADGSFNINPTRETVVNKFSESIFRKNEYLSAQAYAGMKSSQKNKHPLIQFAVNKDFTEMYINVGAPSDDCASGVRTLDAQGQCIQSEAQMPSASVWRAELENSKERKVLNLEYFARGLRNSMALAVHESGTVVQGENSLDLPDEDKPYEEINILVRGQHYGWPYCHSRGEVAPFFAKKVQPSDCRDHFAKPLIFMPAHTAPLGMIHYSGSMPLLRDRLVVSWHGYRAYGQRIVAYKTDNIGRPLDEKYEEVVSGWEAQTGVRPRGAPTGLLQLHDGSVLVLDDKNSAVLRLSQGSGGYKSEKSGAPGFSEEAINKFKPLMPFLTKNCALCHSEFKQKTPEAMLGRLGKGMLNVGNPSASGLYQRVQSQSMPPVNSRKSLKFSDKEYQDFMPKLEIFLRSLK